MQTKISHQARKINWKRFLSAAAVGAFTLAPIAGLSPSAEAQPDWNNRNRDNRRDDRNDRLYEARTLEGIVSNDRAGREFVLRLDNGRTIQVRSNQREPRRLSDGDRVRVQGSFDRTGDYNRSNTRYNDNLIFHAFDVQVIRNRGGNNGYGDNYSGRRTLNGIVTDIQSDSRLRVRIDGREYNVRSNSRLDSGVNRGERVRVYGDMRGNEITNANVTLDRNWNDRDYNNGRYNYGSSNNSRVNFPATVIDTDERDRTLRVRGENGREYNLRVEDRDDIDDLRRGQRVMIRGRFQDGRLYVDDVDRI